jgi:hypothetical protein
LETLTREGSTGWVDTDPTEHERVFASALETWRCDRILGWQAICESVAMREDAPDPAICPCTERDADALAGEILRYLRGHRAASDTVEGIARWWIKRQRLEDTLERVQSALDLLVADARLVTRESPSGRVLYRLPPDAGDGGGA